ncbi:ABC transporter substrate-binding protein [Paenibacillus sp. YAF4_2]|uniref:ABC transporter substrate-binding protein n=1 Tax=Paenibacillus sp. YAF4_2 TaxID=3233085 RepID=UPI003F9B29E0
MRKRNRVLKSVSTLTVAMALLMIAACGNNSSSESANEGKSNEPLTKVKIQLKWVPQAQFAGIFVAKEKGFYEQEGLDVEIIPGGPDVVIEQQVVNGAADIGVTSFDSLLVNRDNGLPLVSVAQILQKSSYRFVADKSSGIDTPEKMKGKKVGMWTGSQQFQVLAFMEKNGLDPQKDVELVKQGFTMDQFFNKQLDVAISTIYNEYHVVLESGVKPEDLFVYDFEDAGVGMLEDTLVVKEDWLKNNHDTAVKAIRATMKGWNYAIANQEESVDIVMKAVTEGSTTKEHQTTMLMEMAKLVKPEGFTDTQVGSFVDDAVQRTVDISLKYGLIKAAPDLSKAIDKTILADAEKS